LFLQVQVDDRIRRRNDVRVGDEVAEVRIFLLADGCLERDGLLRDLQHLAHLRHRNVHPLGNLFGGRFAAELLHERARRADELVDRLDHVDRDADRPRLVGNRARDGLPDPPRGVGRELVAAPVLELVDGLHQADVAFLNQVEELQAAVRVLLRDRDHEAEVGFDQLLLGLLGLRFAFEDRLQRPRELLDRLAQLLGHGLDLLLVLVAVLEQDLLLVLADLPASLLLEPLLDEPDLALPRLDVLDGALHAVDQPPLDRLGELDPADQARQLDPAAQQLPPRLAVLLLLALRNRAELGFELPDRLELQPDLLNLLEQLALPRRDLLVGDLLVVEHHELADRPLAALELLAHLDDLVGHLRRARDRLDDRELALLDALGDGHLALAREQRHRAHLAQVHPHRVVRLVEGPRRQVELALFTVTLPVFVA